MAHRDPHTAAWTQPRCWLRKLDHAVSLPPTQLLDHPVRYLCWPLAVLDQPDDAGRGLGGVPLQLDHDEKIAGEQRPQDVLAPAVDYASLSDTREPDCKPGLPQEMGRHALALRVELHCGPERHAATICWFRRCA